MMQEFSSVANLEIELSEANLHVGARKSEMYHHLSYAVSYEYLYNLLIAECVARRGGVPQ